MQRPAFRGDLIDLHVVGAGLVLLGDQAHAGSHGGGHRSSQDAALREPRPFAALVDVVHQRELPLTVQRFGNGAAHGRNSTKAVARKVGAIGWIYTDQEPHLLQGIKKAPNQSADAQKINWNLTFPRIYIQFLFEYRIKYRQHVINPIIGFPVIKLCIGINSKRYLGVNERRRHKFCKYDLLFYRIIISVIIIILIRT